MSQFHKMNTLTKNQKDFLIDKFFKNDRYPGYRSVAEKLLSNGKCIVAGVSCIWMGGIGNFIRLSTPEENFVDCVQYNFNLNEFLGSTWFKEVCGDYIQDATLKLSLLNKVLSEIDDLYMTK